MEKRTGIILILMLLFFGCNHNVVKTTSKEIDTIVVIHHDTTFYNSDSLNTIFDTIKIEGKQSTVFVYRDSLTHVILHEKPDTIKIFIPHEVVKEKIVPRGTSQRKAILIGFIVAVIPYLFLFGYFKLIHHD